MPRLYPLSPLALALLLPMNTGWAAEAPVERRTASYAITAQPLASALAQFARQNGLQLSFNAALAQGRMAPAVQCQLEEGEALQRLLQGSGLLWNITPERTLQPA